MMMMESKWFFIVVITVLLLQGFVLKGKGCLEVERIALLQLKSFFNQPRSLSNWLDVKGSDCCQWERVECSITTKRVIRLSLNYTIPWRNWGNRHWYLNASLFLPFHELKSLDLSGNRIAGFVDNKGFGKLSSVLDNLEILDLGDNYFNDSILPSLTNLLSLKSLNLEYNQFTGGSSNNYNATWLYGLSNLETLDLSGNNLKNNFLLYVGSLSSLKTFNLELNSLTNLRNLDLSNNQIESLHFSQGGLSSLKTLNLRGNQLKGSLVMQELNSLTNLRNLDLSENQIESLHFSQGGLSSLKTLNFKGNQLKGSLVMQELNSLTNLRNLDLSSNQIESLYFSQGSARQLMINLEVLDLSGNYLQNSTFAYISGLSNLTSLNIAFNHLQGSIDMKELNSLTNLRNLDLSRNQIESLHFSQGSARQLMMNLEVLDLSYNSLQSNTFAYISGLSNLTSLNIAFNHLQGSIDMKGSRDLWKIEYLDLSNNALEGPSLLCLNNSTNLQYLDISNNHFEIPSSFKPFANHSHLKFLFIGQNNLVGDEPTFQTWTQIPSLQLQVLSMSNCTPPNKKLPNFLYYQQDLRYLDLSYNNFGGKIPSWLLENNTRLQQLFLIGNSFTDALQLPKRTNVDMVEIYMSMNKIEGQIPMNICSTFPNLEMLSLFQNALQGNIPPCLGGLKSLFWLDLSYNHFSGGIPEEIAQSFSLETLRLSKNNLSGKILPTIFSSNGLQGLYLDGNNFEGEIPLIDFSTFGFLDFGFLDLSNNNLSGRLPKWIWNASNMMTLDLSNNHFDGLIPSELCNLVGLNFLDLSRNNISGSLPSCFNPPYIEYVHLSKNRLDGPFPRALYNSSYLVTLDLSHNNFSGKIPDWIGTLSALSILLLKANHFEGGIPSQLCQLNSLSITDLSHNKLLGSIPSCLSNLTLRPNDEKSLQSLGFLHQSIRILQGAEFGSRDLAQTHIMGYIDQEVEFVTKKGMLTYFGSILKYMSGIDLSCNKLTGEIPPEIGNLSQLHALNLSHNSLNGFIPSNFSNLKQIESLDLSSNNLSGRIPIQLTELNFLEVFNVSYNNLSGSIPYTTQFETFDESSYIHNPFLCGPPLPKSCNETESSPTAPNPSGDKEEEGGLVDEFVFLVSFLVSYGIVLMIIATLLYINPYWRQAWFYFIEQCITTCHYFIEDHFPKLPMFRRS